jgi:hypothetical protein
MSEEVRAFIAIWTLWLERLEADNKEQAAEPDKPEWRANDNT